MHHTSNWAEIPQTLVHHIKRGKLPKHDSIHDSTTNQVTKLNLNKIESKI